MNKLKEELLPKIIKSTNEGLALSSIFIPNDERIYNADVISKMWKYFTLNNKSFLTKFGTAKWKSQLSRQTRDISQLPRQTRDISQYDKKYVKAYKDIWEPFFQGFIQSCSLLPQTSLGTEIKNNYIQFMCSFNKASINNICIVFDKSRFLVITIKNNHTATDRMNDALIKMDKFGQFVHIFVTK